jgi:hypothetical protein
MVSASVDEHRRHLGERRCTLNARTLCGREYAVLSSLCYAPPYARAPGRSGRSRIHVSATQQCKTALVASQQHCRAHLGSSSSACNAGSPRRTLTSWAATARGRARSCAGGGAKCKCNTRRVSGWHLGHNARCSRPNRWARTDSSASLGGARTMCALGCAALGRGTAPLRARVAGLCSDAERQQGVSRRHAGGGAPRRTWEGQGAQRALRRLRALPRPGAMPGTRRGWCIVR